MAKFNVGSIISGVEKALEIVKDLAPIAKTFGIVPNVATIAITAMDIITSTIRRASEAKEALSTQDKDKLENMLEQLQAANDKLNAVIENS